MIAPKNTRTIVRRLIIDDPTAELRFASAVVSSMGIRFHSSRMMPIVRRIYYHVAIALWATLVGYVIFFLAFVVLNVAKTASRAESLRAQEIAAEQKSYCEKWGMMEGTHEHTLCTLSKGALSTRLICNQSPEVHGLAPLRQLNRSHLEPKLAP